MPSEEDTRYEGTAPPTLETLQAMLESLASAKAYRNKSGTRTRLIFEIDAAKLHGKGASCYATGEQIAAVMLEAINRMIYFDGVTKDYAKADKAGTTPADIQAFINNELKHVSHTGDLASSMRRRMYGETLQKLVELGVWRAAADAQRFQAAQEAERKRKAYWEETNRKAQEQEARWKAKADQEKKESKAGADRPFGDKTKGQFGDGIFNEDFASAFAGARGYWEKVFEERIHGGFYGADFAGGGSFSNRSQQKPPPPKARNKGRAPWYEVLGVPPNADETTIKKAWRVLASALHPDKLENANDPAKLEKLKDVNTAKDEGLRGLA